MEANRESTSGSDSAEIVKWPAEFSEFEAFDSSLKCTICYEYLKTAMITDCSHTFCSMCIRQFLQFSSICPVCFETIHDRDLRKNRPLDSVISFYVRIKDKLLKALRVAVVASNGLPVTAVGEMPPSGLPSAPLPQEAQAKTEPPPPPPPVTPKASGIKSFVTKKTSQNEPQQESGNKNTSRDLLPSTSAESPKPCPVFVPKMFTITRTPTPIITSTDCEPRVPCPVCQVDIPSRNINRHLDACLSRGSNPQPAPVKKKKDHDMAPLPRRLLRLLTDKDLRRLLKDYGLNTKGDRKQMIERIKKFTLLYNAEMDVEKPRHVSEIIAQVHREEKQESRKGVENPLFKKLSERVDRNSNPTDIEKANKEYLSENKDQFQKLIESMRARNGMKPKKPKIVELSDEEASSSGINRYDASSALTNSPEYSSSDNAVPSTSQGAEGEEASGLAINTPTESGSLKEPTMPDFGDSPGRWCRADEPTGWTDDEDDSSDSSVFDYSRNIMKVSPMNTLKNVLKRRKLFGSQPNRRRRKSSSSESEETSAAEFAITPVVPAPSSVVPDSSNTVPTTSDASASSPPVSTDKEEASTPEIDASPTVCKAVGKRKKATPKSSNSCSNSEESVARNRPRRNIKKIRSLSP